MASRWYYRIGEQVVGPVSAKELKWLIDRKELAPSALIRNGEEGDWLSAERLSSLAGDREEGPSRGGREPRPEWYYTHAGRKLGPVPVASLKQLLTDGTLPPDELVWRPGMDRWLPAATVPELTANPPGLSSQAALPLPTSRKSFGRWLQKRPRWAMAGSVLLLLLLLGWLAIGRLGRDQQRGSTPRQRQPTNATAGQGQQAEALEQPPGEPENLLDEAISAVRLSSWVRAATLLDRYLADPRARSRDQAARLKRELGMATSAAEAARIAGSLNDQQLRRHLESEAESLVASLETPELRTAYRRNLMRALRFEQAKRQAIPRNLPAQPATDVMQVPNELAMAGPEAADQEPVENDAPVRKSILGLGPQLRPQALQGRPVNPPDDGHRPDAAGALDLDQVLARIDSLAGTTVVLDGLFKLGTRISEVVEPSKEVLGLSIPLARDDGRTVSNGAGTIAGQDRDVYLVLDGQLARVLNQVFSVLKIQPTVKPLFKATVEVRVGSLIRGNRSVKALVITSLEILGECDYVRVAQRDFAEAFRVIEVKTTGAKVEFGNGLKWVELLGGEAKFVGPIRHRFREIQRRLAADSRQTVLDSVLRRSLADAVRTGTAVNTINTIRGLQAASGQRILP